MCMMELVDSSNEQPKFLRRLCAALFKPVDISFLIFFRILFGGIMLWEVCRYFMHDWITRYYVDPVVTFTYYGFSWVKPWPERGMYFHFFVLGLAVACAMAGFPSTHESSLVGARPSSAAPVEQKLQPPTQQSSSVGARPSSAAPADQNHLRRTSDSTYPDHPLSSSSISYPTKRMSI